MLHLEVRSTHRGVNRGVRVNRGVLVFHGPQVQTIYKFFHGPRVQTIYEGFHSTGCTNSGLNKTGARTPLMTGTRVRTTLSCRSQEGDFDNDLLKGSR